MNPRADYHTGRYRDRARHQPHDASGHAVAGPIPVGTMAHRHGGNGRT